MEKYRLIWQGDGALDLPQVLDDRGVPIVIGKKGGGVNVDATTYKHPLVQNYVVNGLITASKLGGIAATPVATTEKPPTVVVTPVIAAPEAVIEPELLFKENETLKIDEAVLTSAIAETREDTTETSETLEDVSTEETEDSDSPKENRKAKNRSSRSR